MNAAQLIIEVLILAASIYLIFFKNYLQKKGENLATKQDIEAITRKVESVKTEYQEKLEEIKSKIHISYKRNEILLNEKIRTFLEIQNCVNSCRTYCEGRYGDYIGSDTHPNSDSIPNESKKSLLTFATELHYLERNNFIFLNERSKQQIRKVFGDLNTHCNMEIAIMDKEFEQENEESIKDSYKHLESELVKLLEILHEELNNNA